MSSKKIAIIGANGTLGPHVLNALLTAGFTTTVISRKSSKSKYSDSVTVHYVSDDPTVDEYAEAVKGCDAIVATLMGSNSALQMKLADAAIKAGVKIFIPADFGSVDSSSPRALELVPLYREKGKVREYLQKLAKTAGLGWTSLVCAHFFDYGLTSGLLFFDVQKHKATIFDGGDVKWSASNLNKIGLAVVKILQNEKEMRNRMVYIQSLSTTQNEVLRSLEKITGQKWEVEHKDSDKFIKETKPKADSGDKDAVEDLVGVLGLIEAHWEGKEDFVNKQLGLKDEDLDEAIRTALGK